MYVRLVGVGVIMLDGKVICDEIFGDFKLWVVVLDVVGCMFGLGIILVGDDLGLQVYVCGKYVDCVKVGIMLICCDLFVDISIVMLNEIIDELNVNFDCIGYIVQLLLFKYFDENVVLECVDLVKDVDGLYLINLGWLVLGILVLLLCILCGIVYLLWCYDILIVGVYVVVIGCGVMVGWLLGLLLIWCLENVMVMLCYIGICDLFVLIWQVDIVVVVVGVVYLLMVDMVCLGVVVIDVGVSCIDDGLVGDVYFDVWEFVGYVLFNLGGVGLLIWVFLLINVVELVEW